MPPSGDDSEAARKVHRPERMKQPGGDSRRLGPAAWLAALVLGARWLAIGAGLVIALMVRAGHFTGWRWWRIFSAGAEETSKELERARAEAEQDLLETSDEMVEAMAEDLPAGGVVNQMWNVVLMPGRFGFRVATTVLKRGDTRD